MIAEFGKPGQLVHRVEVATGPKQDGIDDGIEMQRGKQRHQIGSRFMKAEIFGIVRLRIGQTDLAVDDGVTDFVRNDIGRGRNLSQIPSI